MEKSSDKYRRNYWGILDGNKKVLFEGTHSECWSELPNIFGDCLVKEMFNKGIRLTRIG